MRVNLSLVVLCSIGAVLLGCPGLPEPPCLIGRSDGQSPYLVQLRPAETFPLQCPQGQQYQVLWASLYVTYEQQEPPPLVTFQLAGSMVDPPSGAQATGRFTTFFAPPGNDVCTIPELTPATDDSVTPVNAVSAPGPTSYTFSDMKVLSDTAHYGSQLQARAEVDYAIPGCPPVQYVAQAVYPLTPCLDNSICLPDPVPTDPIFPVGRGLGSQMPADNRVFCNLDPALLDNPEIAGIVGYWAGAGRGAYTDPDGGVHDVGLCFFSEPFPSLCPAGSRLGTSGPCQVGPGSNPH